jgi:hypothetical protein
LRENALAQALGAMASIRLLRKFEYQLVHQDRS